MICINILQVKLLGTFFHGKPVLETFAGWVINNPSKIKYFWSIVMDDKFLLAFNYAMMHEVGKFWNPEDQDVIEGRVETKEQMRKVGYVNVVGDRGGETKYGIAKRSHPDLDVRGLNLDAAQDIYFDEYWVGGKCNRLPYPLSIMHFDGCINHGVGRAGKLLQKSLGIEEDGSIGPNTLSAISILPQRGLIEVLAGNRENFYNAIVENDQSQAKFLSGWFNRIHEVTSFVLSKLE